MAVKVSVVRGHVVFEVPVTPEDIRRVTDRGTFVYLMSHGYAEGLGVALIKSAVLAQAEREQIEADADTKPVEAKPGEPA